ncbi:hypothetical protein LCM26_16940 [Bacillus stratosphericus]|nr:hypothetical protein ACJ64_03305 [Bacillus safensis]MCA1020019.1 hypothetical protein [Bacillus stratosphericus]
MKDNREFRSFIVLKNLSYLKWSNETRTFKTTQDYKGEKVIVKQYSEDEPVDYLDYEILWETKREITSEYIDEKSGEIFSEADYIKKVAQISVWMYKDLPFWIVFLKGIAANKVISFLNDSLPDCDLSRVSFNEEFFNLLLNSHPHKINVLQTTMKSESTEQEFSISGFMDRSNYSVTDGYITELQIEVPSDNLRAKFLYSGRVALYNNPDKQQVNKFIHLVGKFLIQSGTVGRDFD